jgi:hypothetical protein
MSARSTWFHKFCQKWTPWLLVECPMGNLHYVWNRRCVCGVGCYIGNHQSDEYVRVSRYWKCRRTGEKLPQNAVWKTVRMISKADVRLTFKGDSCPSQKSP